MSLSSKHNRPIFFYTNGPLPLMVLWNSEQFEEHGSRSMWPLIISMVYRLISWRVAQKAKKGSSAKICFNDDFGINPVSGKRGYNITNSLNNCFHLFLANLPIFWHNLWPCCFLWSVGAEHNNGCTWNPFQDMHRNPFKDMHRRPSHLSNRVVAFWV